MSSAMNSGTRAMWMRGGTSKGLYFLADDVPQEQIQLHAFLLSVMGSPDERQIDGIGGADPLTSKVAIVSKSERADADLDYHFYQVYVDQALVSDAQACGNIISGVGPFALDRGLIKAQGEETSVAIHTVNTGQVTQALIQTPDGQVSYKGSQMIDGVPKPSAPVLLQFDDSAGSMCGSRLPTGKAIDTVEGLQVTMIDDGMPCVLIRAKDMGITGYEAPSELEAMTDFRAKLETLRLACGPLMNLGDVTEKSVPKMTLLAPAQNGGLVHTRSFIPHRCHKTIGVMAAVTVASACLQKGTVADGLASAPQAGNPRTHQVEHPSGALPIVEKVAADGSTEWFASPRTARKLMDGMVFPHPD